MFPADRTQYRFYIYNFFKNYNDKKSNILNSKFPLDIEYCSPQSTVKDTKIKYLNDIKQMPITFTNLITIDKNHEPISKDYQNFKNKHLVDDCKIENKNKRNDFNYNKNNRISKSLNTLKIAAYINNETLTCLDSIKYNPKSDSINYLEKYKTITDTKLTKSNSQKIDTGNYQKYITDTTNTINMSHQYITAKPKLFFQADTYSITQIKLYNYYTITDSTNIINSNNKIRTILHELYDYYTNETKKYIQTLKRKIETNPDKTNFIDITDDTVIFNNIIFNDMTIYSINSFNEYHTNLTIVNYDSTVKESCFTRPSKNNIYIFNNLFSVDGTTYYNIYNNDLQLTYLHDNLINYKLHNIWFDFSTEQNIYIAKKLNNYKYTQQIRTECDLPCRFPDKHIEL